MAQGESGLYLQRRSAAAEFSILMAEDRGRISLAFCIWVRTLFFQPNLDASQLDNYPHFYLSLLNQDLYFIVPGENGECVVYKVT